MIKRPFRVLALYIAIIASSLCGCKSSSTSEAKPQAGNWTPAPPMRHARAAHAVVANSEGIYAIAGTGNGNGAPVLEVERFDGVAWNDETTLP